MEEKKNKKRGRDAMGDKVPNADEPAVKRKRAEEETGKPQATNENGEELLTSVGGKPTFICAIYRRDIIRFLPRHKIEQMRTLSRRWNYDIVTTSPDYLPRIIYSGLDVLIGKGYGYRLTKDGYVNGKDRWKVTVDIDGRAIQRDFSWFSRCCNEVKERAGQELNGQRVFPHRNADDVVVVRLGASFASQPVFRAPNRLTAETGGTLIHFLSHLDGCSMGRLQVQEGLPELRNERGEPIGALNPRIFTAYRAVLQKPLRLYAEWVHLMLPVRETSFRTARQLVGKFRCLCYNSRALQLDEMLALLTTAHLHCSMIHLSLKEQLVDTFVEYYRDYNGDIDSLVPEVHLTSVYTLQWPATCPTEDAQAMVERRDEYGVATRKYTFILENAASGRKFEVVLDASLEDRTLLDQFTIGSSESSDSDEGDGPASDGEQGRGEQTNRGEERIRLTGAALRLL